MDVTQKVNEKTQLFVGTERSGSGRDARAGLDVGEAIKPIQITPEIAEDITAALQSTEKDAERHRTEALCQLERRQRAVVAKMDRGYDDFVEGRISPEFWDRKSKAWEAELQVIDSERTRLQQPRPELAVTAQKILELARQAENLYESQDPAEQRRRLETVLSNCTLDRGSLCVTYSKPFDLLVRGNETGEWRGRRDSNPRPPA